jgi:hypothetical protein
MSGTDGRIVLAIDDLLEHAPRHLLQAVADNFRDRYPAAVDQMIAATAEQRRVIENVHRKRKVRATTNVVPDWLRLPALQTLLTFADGQAETCQHAHPDKPQPIYAAAWRPGLVTCGHCTHLFRLSGPADHVCDRCGQHDDTMHQLHLTHGALVYMAGVCTPCAKETAP